MGKITIKNILDNYIPQNYGKGMSGRPLSWEINKNLLKADIPITIIWVICTFFSHGSYKEIFTAYAWIWGLNALVSLMIVSIVSISRHKELLNKWTSPITLLMMVDCTLNINLSFVCLDYRIKEMGFQIIENMTIILLIWTCIHMVVHFIIAIISIYKGKNVGEKISTIYICLIFCISGFLLILSRYEYKYRGLTMAFAIMMSVWTFITLFNIRSVYLNFHPEKYVPAEEEDDEGKETLSKSKKYLK